MAQAQCSGIICAIKAPTSQYVWHREALYNIYIVENTASYHHMVSMKAHSTQQQMIGTSNWEVSVLAGTGIANIALRELQSYTL